MYRRQTSEILSVDTFYAENYYRFFDRFEVWKSISKSRIGEYEYKLPNFLTLLNLRVGSREFLLHQQLFRTPAYLINVYFSPQDIEQFKAEIEKRQLKDLPIPGVLSEVADKTDSTDSQKTTES